MLTYLSMLKISWFWRHLFTTMGHLRKLGTFPFIWLHLIHWILLPVHKFICTYFFKRLSMTHQKFMFTRLINIPSFHESNHFLLYKLYLYIIWLKWTAFTRKRVVRICLIMVISTGKAQRVEFLYIKLSHSFENFQQSS